jgi:hypothetical protein
MTTKARPSRDDGVLSAAKKFVAVGCLRTLEEALELLTCVSRVSCAGFSLHRDIISELVEDDADWTPVECLVGR